MSETSPEKTTQTTITMMEVDSDIGLGGAGHGDNMTSYGSRCLPRISITPPQVGDHKNSNTANNIASSNYTELYNALPRSEQRRIQMQLQTQTQMPTPSAMNPAAALFVRSVPVTTSMGPPPSPPPPTIRRVFKLINPLDRCRTTTFSPSSASTSRTTGQVHDLTKTMGRMSFKHASTYKISNNLTVTQAEVRSRPRSRLALQLTMNDDNNTTNTNSKSIGDNSTRRSSAGRRDSRQLHGLTKILDELSINNSTASTSTSTATLTSTSTTRKKDPIRTQPLYQSTPQYRKEMVRNQMAKRREDRNYNLSSKRRSIHSSIFLEPGKVASPTTKLDDITEGDGDEVDWRDVEMEDLTTN